MNKGSILVVEDERIIALDIKQTLINLGYSVPAIASSGVQALEKIIQFSPDLVLMDIMLQGEIDGVKTAEKIRHSYQIPVVYLTSHTDEITLQRAKATEPFGYIVKPFDEKDLYTTVEIAMARGKAEAEIRKALIKEQELNELKSRFVSMVSHEFRTPMATILFSAGLLENYGNEWPENKKIRHLQRIQTAVQHMTEMLDYVLLIGQSEAGKLEFKPASMNLEKFCSDLIEEIQILGLKTHQFSFVCEGNFLDINMDERLLRHIFTNLLSNAIKYSPEGGKIEFKLTENLLVEHTTIDGLNTSRNAVFTIQDQGIGIPEEDIKHLFESFHRAANVGTIAGTGLGLAIVKKSVELHQGTIEIKTKLGVGTTFIVTLPTNTVKT
ncbi:MAG TPA: ATP-binding protein [Halomicronema sp.]